METDNNNSNENYKVKIFLDVEANTWVAVCEDIPLTLYANTIEALLRDVRETTSDYFELNPIIQRVAAGFIN